MWENGRFRSAGHIYIDTKVKWDSSHNHCMLTTIKAGSNTIAQSWLSKSWIIWTLELTALLEYLASKCMFY